jgi:hypothetical protein
MIIEDKKYSLDEKNYVPIECIKKQIVIGNTNSKDMTHVIGWKTRLNGNNKKTAAFTIDKDGVIHKHFEPTFQSKYFSKLEQNTKSIIILLENEGYLTRKSPDKNFYNWKGDIYNGIVVGRMWKGINKWATYTQEQLDSCVELCDYLCDEFFIPKTAIGHNTKIEDTSSYNGVLYKSNISKHYFDVSPAWDCEQFKNKLESKN